MWKWIKNYWLILVTSITFLILLAVYYYNFNKKLSPNPNDWSAFGDYFGGTVGPIIGLITIVLTYQIINNQLKENNQAEFKYIFQLLFESIDIQKKQVTYKLQGRDFDGSEAIKFIVKDIKSVYISNLNHHRNQHGDLNIPYQVIIEDSVSSVLEDVKYSTGPFMKILHNCLKTIESQCNEKHKKTYARVIRTQLDNTDLVFIYYNCLITNFTEFKQNIEKYSFLNDITNHEDLMDNLTNLYDRKAFKQ